MPLGRQLEFARHQYATDSMNAYDIALQIINDLNAVTKPEVSEFCDVLLLDICFLQVAHCMCNTFI